MLGNSKSPGRRMFCWKKTLWSMCFFFICFLPVLEKDALKNWTKKKNNSGVFYVLPDFLRLEKTEGLC